VKLATLLSLLAILFIFYLSHYLFELSVDRCGIPGFRGFGLMVFVVFQGAFCDNTCTVLENDCMVPPPNAVLIVIDTQCLRVPEHAKSAIATCIQAVSKKHSKFGNFRTPHFPTPHLRVHENMY
jgi:hypothetical protein